MTDDLHGVRLGPLSMSIKCSTGHRVDASTTEDGYLAGRSLRLKGGMWDVEIPQAEAMSFRDWLLLQYPVQRALPSPKPAAVIASQEKAARAAAWARSQEPLLKRIAFGDLSCVGLVDWVNVMRAVRRVGGLDGQGGA